MAYVECKVWSFSDDIANNCKRRSKAMKEGHAQYYTVKSLIDTSSCKNFIRKSAKPPHHILKRVPNALEYLGALDLSIKYEGEDSLVSCHDEIFNDFVVVEEPKADLVLGLLWLRLRETKVDIGKSGITIYGIFVPFIENSCKVDN
ncbi:hypothetical protein RhiirA4_476742 [Rhizophagus irregularis]|uniref:Uncharacterized protein n=1 Tax=Rhizophagus irregularis TaxID=588596 RepID=A0A2I1HC28_9GLOM|nr:hypothetical protein RhiirA4_476742 [Rhizophagus irregularis]